jgi:hypothetical protein
MLLLTISVILGMPRMHRPLSNLIFHGEDKPIPLTLPPLTPLISRMFRTLIISLHWIRLRCGNSCATKQTTLELRMRMKRLEKHSYMQLPLQTKQVQAERKIQQALSFLLVLLMDCLDNRGI